MGIVDCGCGVVFRKYEQTDRDLRLYKSLLFLIYICFFIFGNEHKVQKYS